MKLLEIRFLRGPNRYGSLPCCLAVVDLDDLAGILPETVPGVRERLQELAPRARLAPGGSAAHLLAQLMLALQCLAGARSGFSRVRQDGAQPRLYRIACGFRLEAVAEMALRQALALVQALLRGRPFELAPHLDSLRALAVRCAMDSGSQAVAAAAIRRRIPLLRLSEDADIYQLGWGCRQKRLQAAASGDTSHIGVRLAEDWLLARQLLQQAGLPVTHGALPGQRFRVLVAGGRVALATAWPEARLNLADRLAPQTRNICIRAAQCLDLDIAAIELVCRDLAMPLREQEGAISGVHAADAIELNRIADPRLARRAGAAIVDAMFEAGNDGRIPVIAVAGTNGKTTTTRMIAHALRLAGLCTGVTSTEGVDIGGQRVDEGDCTGYWSARMVLGAPQVQAAVLETARGGLLKRGLGFDRCDVAVMLNVSADHLGLDGVHSLAELAAVKAVVVRNATRAVVLNAEDPHCVAMAQGLRRGVEQLYFSLDAENPVLLRHLAGGGRAVYLEDSRLVLAGRERHQALLESRRMPATLEGHARHNIANGLAAAAALTGAGHSPELVVAALSTFVTDAASNPLRGNLFQVGDVRIIVDYAHNAAACASLAAMARSMSEGKLVAVMTVPGDRRDGDLQDIGRVCGAGFDELLVYEADPRGRKRGETAQRILAGARAAGGGRWMWAEPDVRTALGMALARCGPGDTLVFTCGSSLDDLIEVVRKLDPASAQRIAQARV
ncbi:MAG: Mur ligase family protein [Noviherbaspirillum sp.]